MRKGRIKIHHFAHKPPVDCAYGLGESELHRRAKQAIFDALTCSPRCEKVSLEASIQGTVRPDIRAYIGNVPVAIEVQGSSLTLSEIERRTRHYHDLGVYLLWLQPNDASDDGERTAPAAWEKWIHGLYYGRLHYWTGGADIIPVHFGEYQIWVGESEWYESNGELRQEGGYDRFSKRWRTAYHGQTASILDCIAVVRPKWEDIPAARIWQSSQKNWW